MAFAAAVEEAAEILEGIDDVPFGKGEEGVVELAPITLLIDCRQRDRRRSDAEADDAGRSVPST